MNIKLETFLLSICETTGKHGVDFKEIKLLGKARYKSSINIPKNIIDLISPIFSHSDLGSDSQLERCLHGQIQNCNEALNQLIWSRYPKDVFEGR